MVNYTYSLPADTGFNVSQGADKYFTWIQFVEPTFINYFFIFLWCVIFFGGVFVERKLSSIENFKKWGTMASVLVFLMTLVLSIVGDFGVGTAMGVSVAAVIVFIIIDFVVPNT